MPRRRALTEAQLEALFALPITEADLIRHWTLDKTDLAAVDRRRGEHNQLGYALQLCAFRYPGRLLRPGEAIPEPALRFVAEQLHVGAGALAAYAARRQTRQEQLDDLREAFGFRMYAAGHGREMLAWLLPVALATTNALAITAALMDELRRRRIVAPVRAWSSAWPQQSWSWRSATSRASSPATCPPPKPRRWVRCSCPRRERC